MYITNIVFQVLDFMCSFLKDGVIEYGVAHRRSSNAIQSYRLLREQFEGLLNKTQLKQDVNTPAKQGGYIYVSVRFTVSQPDFAKQKS